MRFLSSGIAGGPQGVSSADSNVAMASWCMSITMWEKGRVCCLLLQYSDMICKKDDDFGGTCTGCCTGSTTSVAIYILNVINIGGLFLQITNDAPARFYLIVYSRRSSAPCIQGDAEIQYTSDSFALWPGAAMLEIKCEYWMGASDAALTPGLGGMTTLNYCIRVFVWIVFGSPAWSGNTKVYHFVLDVSKQVHNGPQNYVKT